MISVACIKARSLVICNMQCDAQCGRRLNNFRTHRSGPGGWHGRVLRTIPVRSCVHPHSFCPPQHSGHVRLKWFFAMSGSFGPGTSFCVKLGLGNHGPLLHKTTYDDE